ncbi:MAG: class I tRNA ligase family protein [Peptococcaceae bacterium]|nr:class I tRNA ligase family protein [Peptococcaceae bacterium]
MLGAWGNFVNRTLAFIYKYFDAAVPDGKIDTDIETDMTTLYQTVGKLIENGNNGNLKEALDTVFVFVRFGNKYFDTEQPWKTRSTKAGKCSDTIYNCVQIIANLAVLLEPFLPFSSSKIRGWLSVDNCWSAKKVLAGYAISELENLRQLK